MDGDFNSVREKKRFRSLPPDHQCARSIFGSTASHVIKEASSYSCLHSTVSNVEHVKPVDAAAEVAPKQVEYEALLEKTKQKERIQQLEEQHKRILVKGVETDPSAKELKSGSS